MVWMTILTGSSGLPANETRRGRQVGQGGRGGRGSEWMSQPALAGWWQIGRSHLMSRLVGGVGCIWTLVNSLVKRDNRGQL